MDKFWPTKLHDLVSLPQYVLHQLYVDFAPSQQAEQLRRTKLVRFPRILKFALLRYSLAELAKALSSDL